MSSEDSPNKTEAEFIDAETIAPSGNSSISSSDSFGSYGVKRVLGQGAMGIVYEAVDSKLDRTVAIKTLPTEFAGDADRVARFKREATLLASLSHPNIATVYSHEEIEGQHCLVMEYVEGQGLDDVIANTDLSLSEILQIALEISSALEVAHNHGVVHRDLKPANIRLTSSFKVKVLDFGLAKNTRIGGSGSSVDQVAQTAAGQVIGTPSYMSPEQARGRTVDKRADLWAVGCILFEMLAGERVFGGDNISDTLVGILQDEPDWSKLPKHTPAPLVKIIERCLQKDVDTRLPDAGMIRIELEEVIGGKSGSVNASAIRPTVARVSPAKRAMFATAFISTCLIGMFVGWLLTADAPDEATGKESAMPLTPFYSEIALPTPISLNTDSEACWITTLAVSPDGMSIAYSSGKPTDPLILRNMGGFEFVVVEGTEGAHSPFFSPDSKQVAFILDDKLCVVSSDGGTVKTLADTEVGSAGTWQTDGYIYFPTEETSYLWRISELGGSREKLIDTQIGGVLYPSNLPDGRLIFTTIGDSNTGDYAATKVFNPADGSVVSLGILGMHVKYCELGYLVYSRGGGLYAKAFDVESTSLAGDEILLASRVAGNGHFSNAHYGISNDGTIVFVEGPRIEQGYFAIMGSDGEVKEKLENFPAGGFVRFDLSPDERYLAVPVVAQRDDIWIYDLHEKTIRKLTNEGANRDPTWTPDGKEIYYRSKEADKTCLYKMSAFGGKRQKIGEFDSWYQRASFGSTMDIMLLDVNKAIYDASGNSDLSKMTFDVEVNEWGAAVSPDDNWVAFVSNRTGTYEIFLSPVPFDSANARQISVDGGYYPEWSNDGRKIFYQNDNKLMTVDFGGEITEDIPAPVMLFEHDWVVVPGKNYTLYGTEGDFIAVAPIEKLESITSLRLIQNALPARAK